MSPREMTRQRARFFIVDALRAALDGHTGKLSEPATFNPEGLGTDDDVTTWAEVFEAADLYGWHDGSLRKANASEGGAA